MRVRRTSAAAREEARLRQRNQLVVQHIGLVKSIARRMAQRVPSQVEVSELMGVGMIGLVDAAGRYEPSLGVPFEAYARRRVHGAMLDSLRRLDGVPRAVRRQRREVDAAISRLRHELQREPTEEEIAQALHLSPEEYERALRQVQLAEAASVRPIDSGAGDASSLLEFAVDPEEGPQVRLERAELKQHLARAIAELPDRERQILALYYQEELSLAEIGEVIGVGESRVSQLRTQAIARLRTRLRETLQLTDLR